jgi:formylglycine-generating enzyme required for sulfatase activity
LRSAKRLKVSPSFRNNNLGFRVAFQAMPVDMVNPELQLFGGTAITLEAGQAWAEPGVEAHDARDGNITDQIVVKGIVDMNRTGDYTLTYTVTDAAGNKDTKTRLVTVRGNRTVDLNATVAMDMIWCPPGTFTMGSPSTEAGRGTDETEHNVSLTHGFYLGKYEVSQAQYEAVMAGNSNSLSADPSQYKGGNRPVENLSWDNIQIFLSRLNEQQSDNLPTAWKYVLPTESQWEYACRAGTTTAYSWGDSIASTNANYNASGYSQTRDVGLYAANPWGFYDMHGNVWEWTADFYNATYPVGKPVIDPTGPKSGPNGVRRGGAFYTDDIFLRSAKRSWVNFSYKGNNLGFRVGFQKNQ